ncbi:alpha-(1,6)-fucosyltransferase isoform X1 [Lepisosteus oculatus]|uniref:Alpha-(1,6)-fucosyltransferase n=1 Tax=Lepisosteus oculatus TaxID=7918 RepID=W5N9V0_LEPOC|nr:PREDICTED: alpha-(1,6)-fucosyltransferase isoform X1 [Lepisosteus oculatus]XP_015206728.1 PREDICTED: alpha-(1,6)-fucosyltransferase isoform X1 [Lepisosteus oculatus]XP_015206729.1 PREDICTED: alpha-(1,6)-fucosyltransferase isoform X1 [Lepisosteus oculatus]XP_015206730.1 PREDICTED: alpha-(1,6)-fucosyltransferase isoform X1 [Lepisosteus oculatus]XP_015206731.1 PREDICTED: alpha-(1,6)-fucosyltransferase isoform X1 [Lepisosteus oculatus]XP_015206732.1 PREDICTED: alpha-(1,6)-fucosyltransferase iso
MRPWTGSWRWIMLILLAWGTLLFYIGGHLVRDNDHPDRSSRELSKILAKLERLKQQNEDLRRMAESLRIPEGPIDQGPGAAGRVRILEEQLIKAKEQIESFRRSSGDAGPGQNQEKLRRKVENGVKELWYFIRSELKKLTHAEPGELQKHTEGLLEDLGHQQRSIMTDLYYLSQSDGAGEWREKEAKDLSDLVQNRISYLQNPKDCSKARKLVCNINKGCGYGCQLHHVVYCFMIAYGTQRTLILESQNWRYATSGWETVFKPVSDTCTDRTGASTGHWSGEANDKDVQVVELPIVDSLHPRPPYLPLAIPEDLADRLDRLHGDPSVWWVSQFVKYLIRPQSWLEKEIEEATRKLGFKHPIIGVHVRRTDKVGTEAAFHPIEEYMVHVEEHFQSLALRTHVDKKRVYLATDDPSLLQEAKAKYQDYEFISDNSISWSAGLHNRYTENSLRGVILDIHFLSQTDFLVCTFSSQVCRVAYEIMQTLHPDASSYFHSLDDIYYFGGQNAHNQIAIYPHHPRTGEEIPLEPGDVIGVAGNHWDGYSKGINRKIGRTGLYPSYKVKEKIETVKYPTYPEADKQMHH